MPEEATKEELAAGMAALEKLGLKGDAAPAQAAEASAPEPKPEPVSPLENDASYASPFDVKVGEGESYASPLDNPPALAPKAPDAQPEAPAAEPSPGAQAPDDKEGAPEQTFSRGVEDMADVLAGNAPKKQYSQDELRTGLAERGYDPAVVDTLIQQHRKADLARIIETPVPQSEGSSDRPSSAEPPAPRDAGADGFEEELAGIERDLIDGGVLEEGKAKSFVARLRAIGERGQDRQAPGDPDVAARIERLEAELAGVRESREAQSAERRASYSAKLQAAREGLGDVVPAILDDAVFETRVQPQLEALYRARPDAYGSDLDALMRAAAVATFGLDAVGRKAQPARTGPAPSPAATQVPRPKTATEEDIALLAVQGMSAGKTQDEIVAEARSFRR